MTHWSEREATMAKGWGNVTFIPGDPIWINRGWVADPDDPSREHQRIEPAVFLGVRGGCAIVRDWPSVEAMQDGKRGRRTRASLYDIWKRDE